MPRVLQIVRRPVVCGLVLLAAAGPAFGQSREQNRRVEEDKRENLRASTSALPATAKDPQADFTLAPTPKILESIYFISLAKKRVAYRYDAMMGILIVLGLDEEYISLDEQVAFFQREGLVPSRYRESFDPMKPLRRGLAAYMFREALEIRGGIALHLLGSSERYAMKELGFQGLMSSGLVNDLINGQELIQTITQAANHLAKRLAKQQP